MMQCVIISENLLPIGNIKSTLVNTVDGRGVGKKNHQKRDEYGSRTYLDSYSIASIAYRSYPRTAD